MFLLINHTGYVILKYESNPKGRIMIMARTVSVGTQSFSQIREEGSFLIDKTMLIKDWWDNKDSVTLIARPRRFGKTLNMNMLECFFSTEYSGRADLFEGMDIWGYEEFRNLQGTYPVISLSFSEVKDKNYKDMTDKLAFLFSDLYENFQGIIENSEKLGNFEKEKLISYNLLRKDVKMEELYKLNIPDNELEYMLEVNPEIKELSVDEVKKHIDILKQINLKEDQIKEILISCPLYLSRNIEDVLDLFKKLLNYKITYLNYFIEADPFILLRDDYEIDEYVKTQSALGRDLNSIIDEFELNPYLIDEWL